LVLGIGNPIMRDDAVGIRVARMIQAKTPSRVHVQIKELSVSGFRLVEEMLGFDRVIIVDSYTGGATEPGRIREFTPDAFRDTVHPASPHGTNFATALEFFRNIKPHEVPKVIKIYTVDIERTQGFGEYLSPAVEAAAEKLVETITAELIQELAARG